MHRYSVILLMATLVNLIVSLAFPGNWEAWFIGTHKIQILLLLFSGPFYVKNNTNFGAFLAYTVIVIMNWLIYATGAVNPIWLHLSVVSGIGYACTLIVILVMEKWRS